jgi:hypothetical protein
MTSLLSRLLVAWAPDNHVQCKLCRKNVLNNPAAWGGHEASTGHKAQLAQLASQALDEWLRLISWKTG